MLRVPPEPPVKTTKYSYLKGADFSVDPSLVTYNRSPMPINMISDLGGNPIKRPGWRILKQLEAPIHNIWRLGDKKIVHAGTKIYDLDSGEILKGNINSGNGSAFIMSYESKINLYILTGKEYLVYDGQTVKDVREIAKVPKTMISRNPTGGGTLYEAVNLISDKRNVSFLGNETDKTYVLPDKDIDEIVEVKVRNDKGEYERLSDYTYDLEKGTVTFNEVQKPLVTGQDNVEIIYKKQVEGYYERIAECTISTVYGYNATNTAFVSGNPKYKGYDWRTAQLDPTYFPDTGYAVVGQQDAEIMGYLKVGESLAIIKSESKDTTVFLRFIELTDGELTFRLKQGIVGKGAISKKCFANLSDEPLFLTENGIVAITSTLLSYERVLKNRSYFIDRKLTKESNLQNAVACEHQGYYILSINGNCYILDSRNKSGNTKGNTDWIYEAYYWENVPATCFLSIGSDLYFGTEEGNICKFNNDIDRNSKYQDGGVLNGIDVEGGEAVYAQWATPNDDDGGVHLYKTLQKKGCCVTLSPYKRSSGKVFFVVDGNPEKLVRYENMDIFDWEDIDFERFTFNSNTDPQEIYFNKKVKKYKRLQIIIVNDGIDEGFGIHEIIKTFGIKGYSKARW